MRGRAASWTLQAGVARIDSAPIAQRVPGAAGIDSMLRLGAIFIAVCMVLIAGLARRRALSRPQVDGRTSAIVALAALTGMALYNTVSNRLRDRGDLGDQIADLSRGTADLARQVAEIVAPARRRGERRVDDDASNRARGAVDPLAAEIGELGDLVRQLAETVAAHEADLQRTGRDAGAGRAAPRRPSRRPVDRRRPLALSETDAVTGARRFHGPRARGHRSN